MKLGHFDFKKLSGPFCRACHLLQVCVHGDAHLGNIMWHQGHLRLIDFDMTAVGRAGAETRKKQKRRLETF